MCPASFQPGEGGSSYVEGPGWKKDDIPEQGSTQALNKNNSAYANSRKREGVRKWMFDVSTKGPISKYEMSVTLYRACHHTRWRNNFIFSDFEQEICSESYLRLMGGKSDRRSKAVARSRIMICFGKGRVMKCRALFKEILVMRRPSHPRLDIAGRYLPEDFAAEMRMVGRYRTRTAPEPYDQEDDDEQEAATPSRDKNDQGEALELKLE
ncbi:hypothetical protein IW261DRAFT_1425765 [Armillaria novae-zelandiae]|uniref:Uncharacterized protein n=1 Tax=Armillaria novae-zelandiae TaxID=153914 RepID=A0AA39NS45_9AGAR|nr:hypothetical protein IW261DRAFT_1425765 [Armillaria novae-zelandiae]